MTPLILAAAKAALPYAAAALPSIINMFSSSGGQNSEDDILKSIRPSAKKMADETGISEEEALKALAGAIHENVKNMGGQGSSSLESLANIAGIAIPGFLGYKAAKGAIGASKTALSAVKNPSLQNYKPIIPERDDNTIYLPSDQPRLEYDPNGARVRQRSMFVRKTQQDVKAPSYGVIERYRSSNTDEVNEPSYLGFAANMVGDPTDREAYSKILGEVIDREFENHLNDRIRAQYAARMSRY